MNFSPQDIAQFEQRYRTAFINSLTGFKSVNLVGTVNSNGEENLAIFSQVFHLGAHPPLIGMIVRPHTTTRHTLENILEQKHFTLNHINPDIFHQAHQTSARYPREVSEFTETGLTPLYDGNFPAPYVQESKLRIGLQLEETQTLAINQTVLVIGSIQRVVVDEHAIQADGFIDLEVLGSITSSGLDSYHTTHRLARLPYAKLNTTSTTTN